MQAAVDLPIEGCWESSAHTGQYSHGAAAAVCSDHFTSLPPFDNSTLSSHIILHPRKQMMQVRNWNLGWKYPHMEGSWIHHYEDVVMQALPLLRCPNLFPVPALLKPSHSPRGSLVFNQYALCSLCLTQSDSVGCTPRTLSERRAHLCELVTQKCQLVTQKCGASSSAKACAECLAHNLEAQQPFMDS